MSTPSVGLPNQTQVRRRLRVFGVTLIALGLTLTVVGMVNFFLAIGSETLPRFFWCAIVGVPMLGIGGMVALYGYAGAMSRYMAGEAMPVAKDAVNYMGEQTRPGVKATASAVAEGLLDGRDAHAASTVKTE